MRKVWFCITPPPTERRPLFQAKREGLAPCGRRSLDSLMLKEFSESDIFCKRWFYFVALRPRIDSGGGNKIKATILRTVAFAKFFVAEREGFEPPVQLPVHRISSAARSTTPASFLVKSVANIETIFEKTAIRPEKKCFRPKKMDIYPQVGSINTYFYYFCIGGYNIRARFFV